MLAQVLSFLPNRKSNRKLGVSVVPGTCRVLSVDENSAADNFGVLPSWTIVSIDGIMVDPKSAPTILENIKTDTKRKKPYKIVFNNPDSMDEKSEMSKETLVGPRPTESPRQAQDKLKGHIRKSCNLRSLVPKSEKRSKIWRKPERAIAGNERLIDFVSSIMLGFTIKEGTTIVNTVESDGHAWRMGVRANWKICEICGISVNGRNVESKLREAKEHEQFLTIRFLVPSSYALLYRVKRIFTKTVNNVPMIIRPNKPNASIKQFVQISHNREAISREFSDEKRHFTFPNVEHNCKHEQYWDLFTLNACRRRSSGERNTEKILSSYRRSSKARRASKAPPLEPIKEEALDSENSVEILKLSPSVNDQEIGDLFFITAEPKGSDIKNGIFDIIKEKDSK